MKYNVICKKIELADSSKEKLLKKMQKLDKFFAEDTEAKIVVSQQREEMIVETTIVYKGFFFRAEAKDREMLAAADRCLENLDRQIRKNKTKLSKRLRDGNFDTMNILPAPAEEIKEESEFKIIKTKVVEAKPMSAEEAILQMNMLGHSFFIFNSPEDNAVNIVYKRRDGNYGLIETENI